MSASVNVHAQGHLLQLSVQGLERDLIPRGIRGDVTTFTRQSRMRMLRLLASLKVEKRDGYRSQVSFLTLTTKAMLHPRLAKRALRTFLKRIKRKYPSVAAVWRMEYQKRGAPHFHLIMYNCPWIDKSWVQVGWGEVVNEERPFTRIERVRSYRNLMGYASKYVAKVQEGAPGFNKGTYLTAHVSLGEVEKDNPGRVWGCFNRKQLPFAHSLADSIPYDACWFHLKAYCQNFWPWIYDKEDAGFTVFCDNPYHALNHIRRLVQLFG